MIDKKKDDYINIYVFLDCFLVLNTVYTALNGDF